MKKNGYRIQFMTGMMLLLAAGSLAASADMPTIQRGGGRDSLKFYLENDGKGIGKAFNILLEEDGSLAVEKAEKSLSEESDPVVKSYLCVLLADYHSVQDNANESIRYLKRAVTEYDQIRADEYYFLVFSRLQKKIEPSKGQGKAGRKNALSRFFPYFAVRKSPIIPDYIKPEIADASANAVSAETAVSNETATGGVAQAAGDNENAADPERGLAAAKVPQAAQTGNTPTDTRPAVTDPAGPTYRIQVGAFSRRENAETLAERYEKRGYSALVVESRRESGDLFIVRVGNYQSYSEAKNAFAEMKRQDPSADGYVTKVTP